ncbi:hypothetical protein AAMO2058_000407700 [Amorphochlora amoebiformis]|uniref:Proteinase inhibitor I42 chagasin domain-containing protein n=1 Tax=Amorphochlora amoebiformis TaxID=1561963 RepID=A0A7S0CSI5_9EUKA|mmetsp:Transcript_12729/g.20167  ORF Transcript_12729/g.20167 Transcript_12729/m.20167 type:complete len:134 (+) Transcript_12729:75-476(+)
MKTTLFLLIICFIALNAKISTFVASKNGFNVCKINHKNDVCIVRLKGNPTTGFTWLIRPKKDGVVQFGEPEFQRNSSPHGAVGVGGFFEYRISVVSEPVDTETILDFYYVQQWARDGLEDKEPEYKLGVVIEM